MIDIPHTLPAVLEAIQQDTIALGFDMPSEAKTGAILATLAASKPGGQFLELGTGTGLSTAWLLEGMDAHSKILSIDNDPAPQAIAIKHLGNDPRADFICLDGETWLEQPINQTYDFIFADSWPGKFNSLDLALGRLSPGGMYIIDDLLPQPNWPEDHAPKVPKLIEALESNPNLISVRMAWASGLMIVVRK